MKGFQIIINNNEVINMHCFYSNVIIQQSKSSYFLLLYGGDELKNIFKWNTKILKKGDKISVKVVNLNLGTPPDKTESADISNLKNEYEQLKLELKNKGLI
ncbi:hypothetical protein ACFRAE_17120 [Sphingobacterium sp. HJSM2_6]|uniref:hypothetical protein n=1 Tax=Sphingobacterium sp. HJSM2_6 TaxID=3366264 RepID=UPI003BC5DA39